MLTCQELKENDDILQDLDQEQLEDYCAMLVELGNFADKVLINTLSMIAGDYSKSFPKSSSNIYQSIRQLLVSDQINADCKLPLVYVIDSILKNVKGLYVELMKDDIKQWMNLVFQQLETNEVSRAKLRKVWNTWKEFNIFPEEEWLEMGQCFLEFESKEKAAKMIADVKAKAAGLQFAEDGTLSLSSALRREMQLILDDIQSDTVEELDKVSLERLNQMNPSLLIEIKKTAEEVLNNSSGHREETRIKNNALFCSDGTTGMKWLELRTDQVVKRCAEWAEVEVDMKIVIDTRQRLDKHIKPTGCHDKNYVFLTGAAFSASAYLQRLLLRWEEQEKNQGKINFSSGSFPESNEELFSKMRQSTDSVDMSKFTTDGVKDKNDSWIASLYEVGLPFTSSSDGRRFRSQQELSQHLDVLFKKHQIMKTMDRVEERGWYNSESAWLDAMPEYNEVAPQKPPSKAESSNVDDKDDRKLTTITADESRDKCAICGVNFKIHYDQDEGEFKFVNCSEIGVLNGDKIEAMLVHMTCLRALGSPEVLRVDQILRNKY